MISWDEFYEGENCVTHAMATIDPDKLEQYAVIEREYNELNRAFDELVSKASRRLDDPAPPDYQACREIEDELIPSLRKADKDIAARSTEEIRELMNMRFSPEELKRIPDLLRRRADLHEVRMRMMAEMTLAIIEENMRIDEEEDRKDGDGWKHD
jgi:hypothetical protein